jgi:hypothetical protein
MISVEATRPIQNLEDRLRAAFKLFFIMRYVPCKALNNYFEG